MRKLKQRIKRYWIQMELAWHTVLCEAGYHDTINGAQGFCAYCCKDMPAAVPYVVPFDFEERFGVDYQ